MNTFGNLFRFTTFGESHGAAVGVIVDGCPAGLELDENDIQTDLDRRRPGQSSITTARNEADTVQILSGIFEGKTTGAPIAMMVWNKDHRSQDYEALKKLVRPGHADFTYNQKYGNRDPRGGGRSSARIMIARVAAGAIAKKFLKEKCGMEFLAWTEEVHEVKMKYKQDFGNQTFPSVEGWQPQADGVVSGSYPIRAGSGSESELLTYPFRVGKAAESKTYKTLFITIPFGKNFKNLNGKEIETNSKNITLNKNARRTIHDAIIEKCQTENIHLISLAVLHNHAHLILIADDNWKAQIAQIKGYSSFILGKNLPEFKGKTWAEGCWMEYIDSEKELSELDHYIQNNHLKHSQSLGIALLKVASHFPNVVQNWSALPTLKGGNNKPKLTEFTPPTLKGQDNIKISEVTPSQIESNIVRCPDPVAAKKMIAVIEQAKKDKDSLGGIIRGVIRGVPAGLGEPEFDKLPALLAHAMMSINATKGFEIGSGFAASNMKGSEHNDIFETDEDGRVTTQTNYAGGVLGGISNGQNIDFRVGIKPVATIGKTQITVDINGVKTEVEGKGRHDPCVLPRAVPIVEAMAAVVMMDLWLQNQSRT